MRYLLATNWHAACIADIAPVNGDRREMNAR
jgi:hypothetical protein